MASGGVPLLSQLDVRAGGGSTGWDDEHAGGGDEHAAQRTTSGRIASPRITPLYKRLPHGPHRLTHNEVIRNQRTRIHGAMIEAVAQDGYEKTSIKQVLALAGVSRRSFYEQFANKEECFLATFDVVAVRTVKLVNEAYRDADGDLEDRLRAAFEQFTEEVGGNGSKSASLMIVQAPSAGVASLPHLCRVTTTFEQMLLSSFTHAFKDGALPLPVIKGIVGGLYEVTSIRLRSDRAKEIPALAEEMLQWTMCFQASAPDDLTARLAERTLIGLRSTNGHATNGHATNGHATNGYSSNGHSANGHSANGHSINGSSSNLHSTNGNGHSGGDASNLDIRERLLECALRLAVLEDYGELSAIQIADEAGVSLDSYFDLFKDVRECFVAAFDEMSDELLWATADLELVGEDWPRAVRKAIGALMRHLALHPLHARMIAAEVYHTEPDAIERNHELVQEIATLLTEGAPEGTGGILAGEGVTGAIAHIVRCQVASEKIHRLPALTDYLTYIVLAPFIGTEAAAGIVTDDDQDPATCRAGGAARIPA
jgi:AcrR family transcriptional regulator